MNACIEPPTFFQFEADFVDSLRCIPMQVRFKLDTCGVKLKLTHWLQLSATERQRLVIAPCFCPEEIEQYQAIVQQLVVAHTGTAADRLPIDAHPAWLDSEAVPLQTQEKARSFNADIRIEQWTQLTPLQRFALIKLSRPSHENQNFLPALKEFGLAVRDSHSTASD
jgi:hypothetical protein